jgi:2-haloacid dehalogenase
MTIKAVVFDAYGTLYDIQSVAAVTERAFPGYGEIVTQIWRIKQLEYTWLRSLMRRYEDFTVVTRESLVYTLRILGLKHDSGVLEAIMEKYLHLDLYPEAATALADMRGRKLAILSNGRRHHQHRLPENLQAGSGGLQPDRSDARRDAGRGAVRLVEPVGCLRRQGVRPERRLD